MIYLRQTLFNLFLAAVTALSLGAVTHVSAETAENLNENALQALQTLYKTNPTAELLSKKAKGVLMFPKVIKAGLVFGGSYGEGVLFKHGKVNGYYNSVTASWGLQAGAQSFSYVVFLMSNKSLEYLDKSEGWEVGVGPSVVLVNEGVAKNLSSSTLQDDAYAFVFDQEGLMASFTLEGTKISHIKR